MTSPDPSTDLTLSLLTKRHGSLPRTFTGLIARLMEPCRHPFVSPHIWVLWGEPYADIFKGIGLGIQLAKNVDWIGSDRPVLVYEGHQHSMFDFLNLPDWPPGIVHTAGDDTATDCRADVGDVKVGLEVSTI